MQTTSYTTPIEGLFDLSKRVVTHRLRTTELERYLHSHVALMCIQQKISQPKEEENSICDKIDEPGREGWGAVLSKRLGWKINVKKTLN